MEHNFLENINEDIRFHLGGRYFLKRYAGNKNDPTKCKGKWLDKEGKVITEPLYSFVIEHGNRWDNSTYFMLAESELNTVMDVATKHLNRIKVERKELLQTERAERKLYPQLIEFNFENVTISVLSELLYNGKYPTIGKKNVNIYANGLPIQYGRMELDKDFVLTYDFIMEHIINRKVVRYNTIYTVEYLKDYFKSGKFVSKVAQTIKKSFVPLHFYIGYQIEKDGIQYNVMNVFDTWSRGIGFETDKGDVSITLEQLLNLKVIGELQGTDGLISLMRKFRYID